jgi:hypothetical protein
MSTSETLTLVTDKFKCPGTKNLCESFSRIVNLYRTPAISILILPSFLVTCTHFLHRRANGISFTSTMTPPLSPTTVTTTYLTPPATAPLRTDTNTYSTHLHFVLGPIPHHHYRQHVKNSSFSTPSPSSSRQTTDTTCRYH